MSNTQAAINRVCEYRGVPKVKKGQKCEVNGKRGRIWGGNSSANFNVKFDDGGHIRNCHPEWRMRIFSDNGSDVIYSGEYQKPAPTGESEQ